MGRDKRSMDRLLKLFGLKDYVFRLTDAPGLRRLAGRAFTPEFMNVTYVPINAEIELPAGTAVPLGVIEHFIEAASFRFIVHECPCRTACGCRDYPAGLGCMMLGRGARDLHPSLGREASRQEALDHLRRATGAGLVSLIGKVRPDSLILKAPDHRHLLTICHCCPCCCVNTSMRLGARPVRDSIVRLEGLRVEVGEDCDGCGACVAACIFGQMRLSGGRAVPGDECKGCGRCAAACPRGAVRLSIEDPRYVEECVERISSLVDVG